MIRVLPIMVILTVFLKLSADSPDEVILKPNTPKDQRLGKRKTLNDYFPFQFKLGKDNDLSSWDKRREELIVQLKVALGLWPMPEKMPLNTMIHGRIEKDGYSIEKVRINSLPGHYVTGNLYRPTKKGTGKMPAILSPHGHFKDGRFYDAGEAEGKRQIAAKAETTMAGARYPIQARCAQLAKMGFVVFQYDMVGYADSQALTHREGFKDIVSEFRLQSFMGLQAWNSIRALDFLLSLPDVDEKRIGVTGASGGGTQTFILAAIDPRVSVQFPAVMVSTAMQGGCVCENCSYLRVETGNVEIAALFAPKPLGMSAADDWTIELEKKGLPELKQLYGAMNAEEKVFAKAFPQFKHNYNQVSREEMYAWFNRYLLDKKERVKEENFEPVLPKELSVYDATHKRPINEWNADQLRQYWTEQSENHLANLLPKDETSYKVFRQEVFPALQAMIGTRINKKEEIVIYQPPANEKLAEGYRVHRGVIGRVGKGDAIPVLAILPNEYKGDAVIWIHPNGKKSLFDKNGKLIEEAKRILDHQKGILAPDLFGIGQLALEVPWKVDSVYAGFTFGYNRSMLAQRVQDILTTIGFAKWVTGAKSITLVGWGSGGPWAGIAAALASEQIDRLAVDVNRFSFERVGSVADEMFMPGALKYGGLGAFLSLRAPAPILLYNYQQTGIGKFLKASYKVFKATDKLEMNKTMAMKEVVDWILK